MSVTATDAERATTDAETPRNPHLCPWWVGYLLASPLRRLVEKPEKILAPLVEPGMTVLDVGSAMGFFSLPLVRMVGPDGRVVCLDVQQFMLDALMRRARRRGLDSVIEPRLCTQEGLGIDDLAGSADLIIAIHMVHETARPGLFISECAAALAPGGRLLIAEPRGHVSEEDFEATCESVRETGLVKAESPHRRKSLTALYEKKADQYPGLD